MKKKSNEKGGRVKKEKEMPRILDLLSMETPDPQFVDKFRDMIGDQKPDYCYGCIKCTSGCELFKFRPEYKPHQLIGLVKFGFSKILSSESIWSCTTCSYCIEVCPQGVSPVDVVKAVRRIAFRSGQYLKEHMRVCRLLMESGHAVPIDEKHMKIREELGLLVPPPTTHGYPDALREVQEILKATGLAKLIESSESR